MRDRFTLNGTAAPDTERLWAFDGRVHSLKGTLAVRHSGSQAFLVGLRRPGRVLVRS
jgi:hypothetical protein